ncbi:MAG: hypothetical protein C0401_11650 [Anaerolinea sp.]|nr:hypothetical protein [Anaerolinea sp.]
MNISKAVDAFEGYMVNGFYPENSLPALFLALVKMKKQTCLFFVNWYNFRDEESVIFKLMHIKGTGMSMPAF